MIYGCTTLTHILEKKNYTIFLLELLTSTELLLCMRTCSGHQNTRMSFQPMKMEIDQIRNKECIFLNFKWFITERRNSPATSRSWRGIHGLLQEEPTWKLHLAGTGGENLRDVSLLK